MAEAALFSLASKLLAKIASPAFVKAYERIHSIRGVGDELEKLRDTINTIQAKLLDAEKREKDSAEVKIWMERVRDVLYDADDLFDEVATDDLIKQQLKGGKRIKEVRVFLSKLNPIVSRDSIAKKVKAIRKRLCNISDDMALFNFVSCTENERPIRGLRRGEETGGFVDPNEVIGRDDEKEQVVDFLYDKSYAERKISLISIVGIGGMGKSTLAQLVYNDGKVLNDFKNRYWACISDILDERELFGKIYQSMTDQDRYDRLSLNQLQERIRRFVNDKEGNFLLVLDDLWDEDHARGSKLWALLSSVDAKGSKIIITTRNSSVSKAYKADRILGLKGLSSDASWELFRRFAFAQEQESDPSWISLGQKIAKKCVNVPLAIKTIASLLRIKDTMEEWKSFEDEELSKIELSHNPIMSTLRLSYDHLPSHLKNCFAYCSLFPKDSRLDKEKLIYLWIAQGYVKTKSNESLETAGHAYFMELYRRSFFEDEAIDTDSNVEFIKYLVEVDDDTKIRSYKMHDLVHDLAKDVAGEESIILTAGMREFHKEIRHVWSTYGADDTLVEASRLHSFLSHSGGYRSSQLLDQQVMKFTFLHALDVGRRGIDKAIPSSIGELKYLRYLNLSGNNFTHLPDSITKLVNLLTLDISQCELLVELPERIGDLIHLRHLINAGCKKLWKMPTSFGELTSLQHLSIFRVSKSVGVDALARLSLRGKLIIAYEDAKDDDPVQLEDDDVQIPVTLEVLAIDLCPSMRVATWWRGDPASRLPRLESLMLRSCKNVKHLPPLRLLPCLRALSLKSCLELEYMEEDDASSTAKPFFPCLRKLVLWNCRKLKGWSSGRVNKDHSITFPFLSDLNIYDCPLLVSMPLAPRLQILFLSYSRGELFPQLVPTGSLPSSPTSTSSAPSSPLKEITISVCRNFTSFRGEGLASLHKLKFVLCPFLANIKLAPNLVEEFTIEGCSRLKFWEDKEEERSVDWASFANLRLLTMDEIPEPEKLPHHLQQLISQGKLKIKKDGFDIDKDDYYGLLDEIMKLIYISPTVKRHIVFNCSWFDTRSRGRTRVHHHQMLVDVNRQKMLRTKDCYILAHQATQVYFLDYPKVRGTNADWITVCKVKSHQWPDEGTSGDPNEGSSHWVVVEEAFQQDLPLPPVIDNTNDAYTLSPLNDPSSIYHVVDVDAETLSETSKGQFENESDTNEEEL